MAVNVARIFEDTIKFGHPYCRICLRTAEETALVNPRNILMFTDVLKLNVFDGKNRDFACYMCEASAATALRMYQACVNAVSIRNVCNPMRTMRSNHAVPEWLRSAILVCNANLREYRQRSTLQQTEVLVVDSAGVEWQPDKSMDPILVVAPNIPADQPQEYETVVLDDDDDASPAVNKKLVPIEQMLDPNMNDKHIAALLPNQMQIISRHEEENNFIIHPLVVGPEGKMMAPSLGAYVEDNMLVLAPDIFQELPLIDCTNKSEKNDRNKNELTCVIQNPQELAQNSINSHNNNESNDMAEIVPDPQRRGLRRRQYSSTEREEIQKKKTESVLRNYLQNYNKKKRTSDDVKHDEKRDDIQYIVDLNMVNDILENKSEKQPLAVISSVVSTSASETEDGAGVITQVSARPVGLVEKGCKIDWEDKIPMDVISFVDATDPNERELIVPDQLSVHQPTPKRASTDPKPVAISKHNSSQTDHLPKLSQNIKRYDRAKSSQESVVIDLC